MEISTIITLYDVPSDFHGKAWSPNVWRARYALNYKGVPYKTVWIEYPEIEPTMRSIGAAPTKKKPDGSPWYTIPVITYPTPSTGALFPPGTKALQQLFYDHFWKNVSLQSVPMALPEVIKHLNEGSRPYWRLTREPIVGGKLEDVCPKGSEKWDGNGKDGNTLVTGTHPTFSDFVIAAFLEAYFLLFPEEWQRIRTWNDGRWERLRDECAKWRSIH
ncbi:hypothetical protein JB92DRAFT_3090396 [Gautieria morchelliformis]|nr:hypothetical protein JB92DRAFT_3090396 [Gautieria morchelliformis]